MCFPGCKERLGKEHYRQKWFPSLFSVLLFFALGITAWEQSKSSWRKNLCAAMLDMLFWIHISDDYSRETFHAVLGIIASK